MSNVVIEEPNHSVSSEEKKNEPWLLNCAKWMYNEYKLGSGLYGQSDLARIRENRAFAVGRESIDEYKKLLGAKDNLGSEDLDSKVFENLDWGRMSFLPKFVAIPVNKYMAMNHKVEIDAIDKDAADYRLKRQLRKSLKQMLGESEENEISLNIRPSAAQQTAIAEKLGGFKIEGEIVHKKLNIAIFEQNEWYEIKRKLLQDFVENSIMVSKDYTCKQSGRVKIRYVDIENFHCSHNRATGTNNSEYFFELMPYTIAELMQYPKFKNYKKADWDKLLHLNGTLSSVTGSHVGNPFGSHSGFSYDEDSDWIAKYKSKTVTVMDFEQVTTDKEYNTIRTNGSKKFLYKETGKNYAKIYNTPNRTTEVETYKNIYRGKWVVGSEELFDYGQQYDIPRPNDADVKPSFHAYRSSRPSIVDLCKGDIRDIRLYQLRLQNLVAKAADPGLAIEYSSLQGLDIAGSVAKPLQLLKLRSSTGTLVYTTHNTTAAFGGESRYGGSGVPFVELRGGIGTFGDELLKLMEVSVNNIRSVTGINEIVDGSSPNPEVTAKQAGLASQSSNNVLADIYDAYKWVKKETAENIALRVQLAVTTSKKSYDAYYSVADADGMEYLEFTKDHTLKQLGIRVKLMPTQEIVADFEITARGAVEAGTIDMVEYHILSELAREGRVEEALVIIDHRKSEKQRIEQDQKENMIKIQGQQNKELEEIKAAKEQDKDKRSLAMEREKMMMEIEKETEMSKIRVKEHQHKAMIDKMAGVVPGKL